MVSNCDAGKDSWEFLRLQGVQTSQSFTRRTDVEAEALILWPADTKSQLIGKDSDAGKDWGQEEKGATEGEVVVWHCWLNEHEFEQIPRQWKTGKTGML